MKKNDLADLKGKTEGELKRILLDLRNGIAKERIDVVLKKSKNTNVIGSKKKDIAKILTILSMKKFTPFIENKTVGAVKEGDND